MNTLTHHLLLLCLLAVSLPAQMEYPQPPEVADSIRTSQQSLLHRKVPEIFQEQRLSIMLYPDSSWDVFRADTLIPPLEVLRMMDAAEALDSYEIHSTNADALQSQLRETRLISTAGTLGGSFYLLINYEAEWVRIIPGFLVIGFSIWKWNESRQLEKEYKREIYRLNNVMPPYRIVAWVEKYNFRLYQTLSQEPIHYRIQP